MSRVGAGAAPESKFLCIGLFFGYSSIFLLILIKSEGTLKVYGAKNSTGLREARRTFKNYWLDILNQQITHILITLLKDQNNEHFDHLNDMCIMYGYISRDWCWYVYQELLLFQTLQSNHRLGWWCFTYLYLIILGGGMNLELIFASQLY